MTSSSTCCGKPASASWFSTRTRESTERATLRSSAKTSSPPPPSSWRAITESARRAIAAEEEKKLLERLKRKETKEAKLKKDGQARAPEAKKQKREPKRKIAKSRKVRIFPTPAQKPLLKAAFEACRHVYNKTVEAVNARACARNRKELRKVSVNKDVWDKTEKDKAWEVVGYELRDGAMLDAFKAIKSTEESMAARGEPEEKQWKFKGRKKKDRTESIAVRSRLLNDSEQSFCKQLFGRSGSRNGADGTPSMKSSKPLPDAFEADVRIWHHKVLDEYYIIIPEEATAVEASPHDPTHAPDTQGRVAKKGACVSIDPGVRTFATCYDPDGLVCKWGCAGADGAPSANAKLWRIANVANSIRARMQSPKLRTNKVGRGKRHRRRRHMRRAAARIEERLRNMVKELHCKLALWLCRNYEAVPGMVRKKDRRGRRRMIGQHTVKELYSLAHCRFREYLRYKASLHGTLVCECDEAYTTQTCGACGKLNYIGSSEVYRCRSCGARFDRDENAARNIMLKFVQDTGVDL